MPGIKFTLGPAEGRTRVPGMTSEKIALYSRSPIIVRSRAMESGQVIARTLRIIIPAQVTVRIGPLVSRVDGINFATFVSYVTAVSVGGVIGVRRVIGPGRPPHAGRSAMTIAPTLPLRRHHVEVCNGHQSGIG